MIRKLLVANRGEIAIRVMRAAHELGIATVAVYSDADVDSLHAATATEAVHIGPAPAPHSYLNIDKVLDAAKRSGADAIHPGFGFLSENSGFARRVREAGLIFVGPSPESMAAMGNKLSCKDIAVKQGVPVSPAARGKAGDITAMKKAAREIGYPVLIKAASGGGGKGMRIVHDEKELAESLERAMGEAKKAFGDDTVFLEKYIEVARHIEIQVLGDTHGHVIHLGERECSIQRRHQKIVEESPSVALNPALRERMGAAAVALAKGVNYFSAGTVEFLLDEKGDFYLLEMNTRIQVEHPVTEMVTGVDLVKWQLRIANGEKLTLRQEDIRQRGHAIEVRVYAEDPENNFYPSPGKILAFEEPRMPGIRHDCGVRAGSVVSVDYDPMLSKLIAWDVDRDACRRRIRAALREFVVLGIKTTIPYLHELLDHPEFVKGNTFTRFIPTYLPTWKCKPDVKALPAALIAAAIASAKRQPAADGGADPFATGNPWGEIGRWEIGGIRG